MRSSCPDPPPSDDEVQYASRVVRTSIRTGRKPSESQRFVKESDPLIKSVHLANNVEAPLRHIPDFDNGQNGIDLDTVRNFMNVRDAQDDDTPDDAQDNTDQPDDGDSDVSDDDILPSFGPQLSLSSEAEVNEDVVEFALLDQDQYNKNVSSSSY